MKVICCGLWKTGTKSLSTALQRLGYRVYDCDEQIILLHDLWVKFFNGTVTDEEIRKALDNVDVLIDGPVIALWYEIFKVFPDAKVILSTRPVDPWYDSFKRMRSVENGFCLKCLMPIFALLPTSGKFAQTAKNVWKYVLGEFYFSDNPRLYKLKCEMHNSFARTHVPKNQLLEFQSTEGWEPLCRFLEVQIPAEEFPHKNKNMSILTDGSLKSDAFKRTIIRVAIEFLLFIGILVMLVVYMMRYFY